MDEMDYEPQIPDRSPPAQAPSHPESGCPAWAADHGPVLPTPPLNPHTSLSSVAGTSNQPNRRSSNPFPYDPVHSLGNSWGPVPSVQIPGPQWSAVPTLPPPAGLPPLQYPPRLPASDSHQTNLGGGTSQHASGNNGTIPPGFVLPQQPRSITNQPYDAGFSPDSGFYRSLFPQPISLRPGPAAWEPIPPSREAVNIFAPQRLWEYGPRPTSHSLAAIQAQSMASTSGQLPPAGQNQAAAASSGPRTATHDNEPRSPTRSNQSGQSSHTTSPSRPVPASQNPHQASIFGGDSQGKPQPTGVV
jgi:hypothetical protein